MPGADIAVELATDGSLVVRETITFAYSGSFSGAFRDIPVRPGELVEDVYVEEGGRRYEPGASAELGSSGAAGTYGVAVLGDRMRVVWHYRAADEVRTFVVGYRMRGLAVAYDDVVDVNVQVWGDEWETGLGRLTATLVLPGEAAGPSYRAWGHPVYVRGDVQREPGLVFLRALDVPAGQFVELRVVFPRSLLTSTDGATVRSGDGLAQILAEERADAADFERDQERIDGLLDNIGRMLLLLLAGGVLPALAGVAGIWTFLGRERRTGYDREYEQEPPSELEPALVPPLVNQGGPAGSAEFTATLFDLIRRGRYKAEPATTEHSTWGGLRSEQVADLEVSQGDGVIGLLPHEERVAAVVDDVLANGPERLSRFRDRITDDRTANSKRFTSFKSDVADEARKRGWLRSEGRWALGAGVLLFGIPAALLIWIGADRFRAVAPRWSDVVIIGAGVCCAINAALFLVAFLVPKIGRRRSPAAQAEAERWEAFRRYLTDFPRLQDAPPASLELWERLLVYGIAFGIAERVLQGAQLRMPEEIHRQSSIYWISPTGDLGSGPTALAIGDLSSGFGSALAPPGSGSGGFGGGFSGGGGGGGGGAW